MLKKIISFIPSSSHEEGIFDPPVLTKKIIPEWYVKQNKYTDGRKSHSIENGNINHTIKGCMPVFDIMTAGYTITLPADVLFSKEDDGSVATVWSSNSISLIESHPIEQYNEFNTSKEFFEIGFKFINPWIIKTPPGYSCLFIHPSYRDDLPFQTLSAVVDTDKHPISVNFPFFIRKDFEGILPMGTPIVQVIPFKRDSWKHVVEKNTRIDLVKIWKKAEGKMSNRYKTFFRSNKEWS